MAFFQRIKFGWFEIFKKYWLSRILLGTCLFGLTPEKYVKNFTFRGILVATVLKFKDKRLLCVNDTILYKVNLEECKAIFVWKNNEDFVWGVW